MIFFAQLFAYVALFWLWERLRLQPIQNSSHFTIPECREIVKCGYCGAAAPRDRRGHCRNCGGAE